MSHSLLKPCIIEVITILDRGRFNHHRLLVTVSIDSARWMEITHHFDLIKEYLSPAPQTTFPLSGLLSIHLIFIDKVISHIITSFTASALVFAPPCPVGCSKPHSHPFLSLLLMNTRRCIHGFYYCGLGLFYDMLIWFYLTYLHLCSLHYLFLRWSDAAVDLYYIRLIPEVV